MLLTVFACLAANSDLFFPDFHQAGTSDLHVTSIGCALRNPLECGGTSRIDDLLLLLLPKALSGFIPSGKRGDGSWEHTLY